MNHQITLPTEDVTSRDVDSPPTDGKSKSRKSKASREKANERYRSFKNKPTAAKIEADTLARLLGPDHDFVFQPVTQLDPIPISLPIHTSIIPTLAESVVNTAVNVHKVTTDDIRHDIQAVQVVTALQLTAKIHYAQAINTIAEHDEVPILKTIANTCNQTLTPLALVIDQVGYCEVEGQKIIASYTAADVQNVLGFPIPRNALTANYNIPRTEPPQGFPELRFETQVINEHGHQLVIGIPDEVIPLALGCLLIRAAAPGIYELNQDFGEQTFPQYQFNCNNRIRSCYITDNLVNYHVDRYIDFMMRCSRRLQSKIVELNIKQGKGSAAILVSHSPPDELQRMTIWSPRKISEKLFYIGGLLKLGTAERHLMCTEEMALQRSEIETLGWKAMLLRTLQNS